MITFRLDSKSGVPFYRQIVDQIRCGIASKKLLPGEQLPTVRALAVELEVNPNTISKAYSELEILDILDTQQGTGTFVSKRVRQITKDEKDLALNQICNEMLARAHQYNISLNEVVAFLKKENRHS